MVVGIKIITFAEINNPARRHSPPCPYQEDRGPYVPRWAVEKIRANKYHRRMGRRSLHTGGNPCHKLHGNHIRESTLEAHAVAFYPVPGYNPLGRESAQEPHAVARYIVPGLNPLGRESAQEAHGTPHTY